MPKDGATMGESGKPTLMQLQVKLPVKIAITVVVMFALILFVYFFKVPNPNMILIAGLVLCSALFGFGGGIVASVIMLGYTLFFFSTGHNFTQFTPDNMQKVVVSLIGITADMAFVCFLKRTEVAAFKQVDDLTKQLHAENEKLQKLSLTDALTGIRNRMALRQDFDSYWGHDVTVMMVDLDNFKAINDSCGHDEGDRILRETAKLLVSLFGEAHCYRYGGDEFLVITQDESESKFHEDLNALMNTSIEIDGFIDATFSIGYVRAEVSDADTLRVLISKADEKMYEVKRDKKRVSVPERGDVPSREMASEYGVVELRELLDDMAGDYDLARVVDPIECRVIEVMEDGSISMNKSCYGIWNADQKCLNCSSAKACRTGHHQEKAEHFQDSVYYIQSNPVKLRLADGSSYDAVVELVNVEKESNVAANDREAENVGNRAAHYLSHHDTLTNVLNADAFYEFSRDTIKSNPGLSWVMVSCNIKSFHLINSLFGVMRGNEALITTASLLREIADGASGLCGRVGPDQFALLIPKALFAERPLLNVAETLTEAFNSGIYTFCIQFGVYEVADASIPVSVMCGRANSALRTIREDRMRTVAYFNDAIMRQVLLEQKVISSFEDALKDGQFKMYLQPLVKEDGTLVGAEALVRWCKPDGSIVMPVDFIDTLETASLVQKLDRYVWELAVKQLSAWKGTPLGNLPISVNMSAKDFFSMDVYGVLTSLIEQYEVDCKLLRLEITETALLVEPEKSDSIVTKLRERGFIVEIDDFGKGYSSLSLLKTIEADVLKIDMSLLYEIQDGKRNWTILKSVINLADSLGMEVITEGVETREQLSILSDMGCKRFQGFYFYKPMPVEEFERILGSSGQSCSR